MNDLFKLIYKEQSKIRPYELNYSDWYYNWFRIETEFFIIYLDPFFPPTIVPRVKAYDKVSVEASN